MSRLPREILEVSFRNALDSTSTTTRHLLLGNGFSIDARESFRYDSLFERAGGFSPPVDQLFRDLRSTDFEAALENLSRRIAEAKDDHPLVAELVEQQREIRQAFLTAVSRVHPDSSTDIDDEEKANCAAFLSHFVGTNRDLGTRNKNFRGKIFTTNYDLLLYWCLVKYGKRLNCHDGYINPSHTDEYGVWRPTSAPRLLYLHGALHIFRVGSQHRMNRYQGHRRLIAQTRRRLGVGEFPLFVSEGSQEMKRKAIDASPYLTMASDALDGALKNSKAALFIFGHGLGERDGHLLKRIGELRIGSVFIGAWGGRAGPSGGAVERWAETWWQERERESLPYPLNVYVFDSSRFSVWKRRFR